MELGLEEEAAGDGHRFALGQTLEDLDEAAGPLAGPDGPPGEGALSRADEDDGAAVVVLNGRSRDGQGSAVAGRGDGRLDEHAGLEAASGIGELDPPLDGPAGGVDGVADEGEPAAELLAGIGLDAQDDVGPDADMGQVPLLDMQAGPDRRRIGQPEQARAELHGVARDDAGIEDRPRKRGPDREQRPRRAGSGQGVDVDLGKAQEPEPFPGPGEQGPGRGLLGRVAGPPGQAAGGLQIELLQTRNDVPSMYRDFLRAGLHGVQHFAYWTEQFDADLARAEAAGFTVAMSGEVGANGRFVYFDDRSGRGGQHPGTTIELSEVAGPKGRLFKLIREAADAAYVYGYATVDLHRILGG